MAVGGVGPDEGEVGVERLTIYKRRNEVERTIDALKHSRAAVATRFDKRGYIFHGTVTLILTVASIRLRLRLRLRQ